MTWVGRWIRFNAVGVIGMGVQLGVLAGLNRLAPSHYLMATALAIEVTLVHNFCWHRRVTWRDRNGGAWWGQMVRFQAANGAVSMVGNLVLMRCLVQGARMPVVWANVLAIGCCSLVNFGLGNVWAFRSGVAHSGQQQTKVAEVVVGRAG